MLTRSLILFFSVVFTFSIVSCDRSSNDMVQFIDSPKGFKSSESNLALGTNGDVLLSWIETDSSNVSKLLFSKLENASWSAPSVIAQGNNWFVNWADFPSLTTFGEEGIVAHYLQKSADDTYAYDVKLSISPDSGKRWSTSFTAHNDGTKTEHGFVSKINMNENSFLAIWLDGRQYAYAEQDTLLPKQMSLRSGQFDISGNLISEGVIDQRTCDCCQTDLAMTSSGPMVVYRDRSDSEIRDIYYSHLRNGQWTKPEALYDDGWEIMGCPVNGPTISAKEDLVSVGWFTLAKGRPEINLLFSEDGGLTFREKISPDYVNPLGRVDIEILNDRGALLSWMDTTEDGKTLINLQKIYLSGEKSEVIIVTETSQERSSGFPRMVVKEDEAYITWTEVGEQLSISTAKVDLTQF